MAQPGATLTGTSVTVTASLTDILEVVLGHETPGQIACIEVQNTGANAFTDFRILGKDHASGEYYDYLLAADFIVSTNSNMIYASTDPSVLTNAAKAHIHFRVNGLYAFKVQAKRTTTTTAVVIGNMRSA